MNGRILLIQIAIVLSLLVSTAYADWPEGGLLVAESPNNPQDPVAIVDGSGGIVLVWRDDYSSAPGIYAQRIDDEGNNEWTTGGVRISTSVPGDVTPLIVPNGTGWTIAWVENSSDIYAAKISLDGVPGTGQLISSGMSAGMGMDMTQVNETEAILAYSNGSDIRAVYVRHDLTPLSLGVVSDGNLSTDPHIVTDNDNGAIVIWKSYTDHFLARARRINHRGWIWANAMRVVDWDNSSSCDIEVASDNNGGAVVAFVHEDTYIVVQRIDSKGIRTYLDALPNFGRRLCSEDCLESETAPSIAMDNNGDAVVAFEGTPAGGSREIYAMCLDLDSSGPCGDWYSSPVFVEAEGGGGDSRNPQVSSSCGGTIVTWRYDEDSDYSFYETIYAQRLNTCGVRHWQPDDILLSDPNYSDTWVEEPIVVKDASRSITLTDVEETYDDFWWDPSCPQQLDSHPCGWNIELFFDDGEEGGAYASWITSSPTECGLYVNKIGDSSVKVEVEHGPAVWYETCTYDRVTESCINASGQSIKLTGSLGNDYLGYNGNLDPTFEYCYKIIADGVLIGGGAKSLQNPRDRNLYISEEFSIDTLCCSLGWNGCFKLTDGVEEYGGHIEFDIEPDEDPVQMPWVELSDRRMGASSIAFRTEPASVNQVGLDKQRVEVDLGVGIPFYEERFTSFSLKINEITLPEKFLLFAQWQQRTSSITFGDQEDNHLDSNPMQLDLRKVTVDGVDTLAIYLTVKNADDGAWVSESKLCSCYYGEGEKVVAHPLMPIGEWVDFVIRYAFDPYGGKNEAGHCGYAELWMNGVKIGDTWEGKIGFPNPYTPVCTEPLNPPGFGQYCPSDETTPPEITFTNVREFVKHHTFGIYKKNQNGPLEILFDEFRSGHIDNEVPIPSIKITADTVRSTFDPATCTWNDVLTFNTSAEVIPTVKYTPVSDGQSDCSSYSQVVTGVLGTSHAIPLDNVPAAPQYCYRIEAVDGNGRTTYILGTFNLDDGYSVINDIASSFNTQTCMVDVEWVTKYPSTNNKLLYRPKGTSTWNVANPSQSDCDPNRYYSAAFSQPERSEFKIRTYIDGAQYESSIMEQSGRCQISNPPPPPFQTDEQEQVVTKAFLRARPNPFNPSTTISYGVPEQSNVELIIYSASGEHIKTLFSGTRDMGVYSISWDGVDSKGAKLSSGVYFSRLTVGQQVLTSKLVLLK